MMTRANHRIAVVGISLESNRFAPPTTEADFRINGWHEGEELRRWLDIVPERAFFERLAQDHGFEIVPLLLADGGAGGPCDHAVFEKMCGLMTEGLHRAGAVDGVFILGHGAGTTTRLDDMDGAYFALIRKLVGNAVPIVALLDLHGKISDAMLAAADALVAYRTNPHLDFADRARECGALMAELLSGHRLFSAMARLPMVTPQITQLTDSGEPMADLVALAESLMTGGVRSVSVLPGFAFSDTQHAGFAIVSVADDQALADATVERVARAAWDDRHRFRRDTIDPVEAARIAREAGQEHGRPAIFADVADNPGGGGRGNTTWLLEAFHQSDVQRCAIGMMFDPPLVADAVAAGIGGRFTACFNRDEASVFSRPYRAEAEVLSLTDGSFTGSTGMSAGLPVNLGPCAVLAIGGLKIAVASHRTQVLGIDFFTQAGIDAAGIRSFVVKSRGHFRAGFGGFAAADRIFEVSAPGLTTPDLASITWSALPRPSYPLDADADWSQTLFRKRMQP